VKGGEKCTNRNAVELKSPSPTLVFFPVLVSHENISRKQVHKINKYFIYLFVLSKGTVAQTSVEDEGLDGSHLSCPSA
jgi:hypothetical protein